MSKYRYDFKEIKPQKFKAANINAQIDFLDKDLFRIALYKDDARLLPTFGVCPGDFEMTPLGRERLSLEGFPMYKPSKKVIPVENSVLKTMGNTECQCFNLGEYKLYLYLPGFFIELYTKDDKLLLSDRPYAPYNYNNELGEGSGHFLKAERYEKIFGLGEKSGNVNKFGRSFTIGARDSMGYDASSTDPLYKHLPYYICQNSVGSYGIYYDTHARSSLNFMEEMDNYYGHFKSFTTDDDVLVYYVFLGDIKHIAKKFAWLVGRSVFSPKWSLDYCGSTMAYTDAPNANEQLLGFLDNCKKYQLPVSGFYLSSGYTSIGDRRYVFNWNTDKIPDPKSLIKTYNDNGVHFIPNIKPAFLEDHPMYEMLAEKGYFLHYEDGSAAKLPFWDGYGSYLDFTNPEAFKWWTSQVKEKLIDYGIDAIWNDNNEFYISDRSIMAHGFNNKEVPAYKICQVLTTLMVMASNEALPKDGKTHFMSTRSGCAGINRLAQTWTGDNYTSFKDLLFNHKMAMGMSISAMPLLGHDLGGFSGGKPSPELFMRWLQYGVLLPRFTVHSWNEDGTVTEPWMYPETVSTVQKLFDFRGFLNPYLYNLLHEVHEEFDFFLTPLFVDYPDVDPESDQFLLGHDLLCAPVFYEGVDEIEVIFPGHENWYDFTNKCFIEPGIHKVKCSINDTPPIFGRGGSVIPTREGYHVIPRKNGRFEAEIFTDDGIVKFEVRSSKGKTEVRTNMDVPYSIVK